MPMKITMRETGICQDIIMRTEKKTELSERAAVQIKKKFDTVEFRGGGQEKQNATIFMEARKELLSQLRQEIPEERVQELKEQVRGGVYQIKSRKAAAALLGMEETYDR